MPYSFCHYLITRFNLRVSEWAITKNNEQLLSEEWMEHRLYLFENFCFPSVAAQTNTNFLWLIYIDTDTSDKHRLQLERLAATCSHVRFIMIDGMISFIPHLTDFISRTCHQPYLITSRVDNDDCLHKDYIGEIQKVFNRQSFSIVDIVKGYSLQIEPDVRLGKKEQVFNPFVSLIESNKNPKTIFTASHASWKEESRIIRINHKRLWMAIIHDKNKINRFDGYDDVKWSGISTEFSVSAEAKDMVKRRLLPYKEWLVTGLRNKSQTWFVLLGKNVKKALGIYKIESLFRR